MKIQGGSLPDYRYSLEIEVALIVYGLSHLLCKQSKRLIINLY